MMRFEQRHDNKPQTKQKRGLDLCEQGRETHGLWGFPTIPKIPGCFSPQEPKCGMAQTPLKTSGVTRMSGKLVLPSGIKERRQNPFQNKPSSPGVASWGNIPGSAVAPLTPPAPAAPGSHTGITENLPVPSPPRHKQLHKHNSQRWICFTSSPEGPWSRCCPRQSRCRPPPAGQLRTQPRTGSGDSTSEL